MKTCIACGNRNNRDEAKRCDQCGAELPPATVPANPPRVQPTVTAKPPVDHTRKFRLPEKLTKEQDLPNDLPMQGRHLLIGGPGSGKSVVALLRAGRLVRSSKNGGHVFLAYNRLLIHFCSALSPVRINAETWETWFRRTLRQQMHQSCPLQPPQANSTYQAIDWAGVSQILSQANGIAPPTASYLVIDEGQDMPKEFYWALPDLGYEHIFVAADFNQVLHPGKNSDRKSVL